MGAQYLTLALVEGPPPRHQRWRSSSSNSASVSVLTAAAVAVAQGTAAPWLVPSMEAGEGASDGVRTRLPLGITSTISSSHSSPLANRCSRLRRRPLAGGTFGLMWRDR